MKFLNHLEEWLIAALIGGATLLTFVAVLHRYGSGIPLPYLQDALLSIHMGWSQELTIYMFVWMAKFGAAYGVRTGIHVGVDVLINRLPDRQRARFIVFGLLAGALFTGIVAVLGGHFVWEIAHTESTSTDLEMPMWLVYLAIPLGTSLMCFRFLEVGWAFIHTGALPHHDHGHVSGLEEGSAEPDTHPRDLVHQHSGAAAHNKDAQP